MQHLVVFSRPPQNSKYYSGKIQYQDSTLALQHDRTTSETVDMGWEAEWDGPGDNEPWATETRLAGSTQKAVQDFRKWWNRYHL